jgi:hypothetical protein
MLKKELLDFRSQAKVLGNYFFCVFKYTNQGINATLFYITQALPSEYNLHKGKINGIQE